MIEAALRAEEMYNAQNDALNPEQINVISQNEVRLSQAQSEFLRDQDGPNEHMGENALDLEFDEDDLELNDYLNQMDF